MNFTILIGNLARCGNTLAKLQTNALSTKLVLNITACKRHHAQRYHELVIKFASIL